MKLLPLLFLATSLAAAPIGPATNSVALVIEWPVQPGVSNVDWRYYATTNVAIPTNQWTSVLMTNVVIIGTNYCSTNYFTPAAYFLSVTGSNFWCGEVPFSAAASTGASPGVYPNPVQNLVLKLP